MPSIRSSTNSRNCGPSSGGKPSMSAMTRIGMCCAYSIAASTTSRPPNASISPWQNLLVPGSCLAISDLVNAGSRSLRASWWKGGSEEIGGEPPIGADSRGGRKVLRMIDRGGNRAVSEASAAEPRGVRDRAALPQVILDPVGVGGPLRLEVREVGRPVRDRAGNDLVPHPERRVVVAGPQVFLAETLIGGHVTPPREVRPRARDSSAPPGARRAPDRVAPRRP